MSLYNIRPSCVHVYNIICGLSTHLTDFSLPFYCVHVEVSLSEPGEDDCGIMSHSGRHYYSAP